MSRFKKLYCKASVVFAVVALVFTIAYMFAAPTKAYASNTDVEVEDERDTETADHNTDTANGLHVIWENDEGSVSAPIKILLLLTVLSLAPSILVMLTSYTRIIIVLHFVRTAIGTQTAPPNQVLIGLALFLTFFIMWPTFQEINVNAIQPLEEDKITMEQCIERIEDPLRDFMEKQTQEKDLAMFIDISGQTYESYEDVPFTTLVPAYIISELRTAFILGFLVYIPFIVIDMIVASVLMSMGMMMLPPTVISTPFKILLFIVVDGWGLIIGELLQTF